MTQRRGARDRDLVVTVEAGTGRSSFDGNHTSDLTSWLLPMAGRPFLELSESGLDQLMDWILAGHLAWAVFPIDRDRELDSGSSL